MKSKSTTDAAKLSSVRAAAGRAGAAARWPAGRDKATARLRCYPADAERLRDIAKTRGVIPADVIAKLLTHTPAM